MTIDDLIARLTVKRETLGGNCAVMILDGFNAQGTPRDLNVGPREVAISEDDANDAADCENRVGEKVLVLGFGCY